MKFRNVFGALAASTAVAFTLAGCSVPVSVSDGKGAIIIGIAATPGPLDPAASRNLDDAVLMQQVYAQLINHAPGEDKLVPDIAASAEYTGEFEYTLTLKPDLTFTNGNPLTASDVVHSITRIKTIAAEGGPAGLLTNVLSANVSEQSDLSVVFELAIANDQMLPHVLSGVAGLVVDEEVFPADELLDNNAIVGAKPWAGPFTIGGYTEGLVGLKANPDYQGVLGLAASEDLTLRYYNSVELMDNEAQNMIIDLAIQPSGYSAAPALLAAEEVAINFGSGPAIETMFLGLNRTKAPFLSDGTRDSDSVVSSISRVLAASIDRQGLVGSTVYFGEAEEATSMVPAGLPGFSDRVFSEVLGNTRGLEQSLARAGFELPVALTLTYPQQPLGVTVELLATELKAQLDESGLFEIELRGLVRSDFETALDTGDFQIYLDGWQAQYADASSYLAPLFATGGALRAGFSNEDIDAMLLEQASAVEPRVRERVLSKIQNSLAKNIVAIPVVHVGRHAVVRDGLDGIAEMFAADGKLLLNQLSRITID